MQSEIITEYKMNYLSSYSTLTASELPLKHRCHTNEEIISVCRQAAEAFLIYKKFTGKAKSDFLLSIADELGQSESLLIETANIETALPTERLKGELLRTINQIKLFASLLNEGSWVNAVIDTADAGRHPLPKPDIRSMLMPLGPVVVFSAGNFPFAFSTAGGDTISALAAGCSVVLKAHEGHLGTNAIVAEAIIRASKKNNIPEGVFSSLILSDYSQSLFLVKQSSVKAVAFTGSYTGGMALHKAANERKNPIPVFAEMGSINPVFILNNKVEKDADSVASQLASSVNLGAGQFCTSPGIIVIENTIHTEKFISALNKSFSALSQQLMLNKKAAENFNLRKMEILTNKEIVSLSVQSPESTYKAAPALIKVKASDFIKNEQLKHEVFGPFAILIICNSKNEVLQLAESIEGQLTCTVFGETQELAENKVLLDLLTEKCGRLLFNGVPTGVEVCNAMQHGGPFPSSTDSRYTSVGSKAIDRFVRPVAFQNMPDELLPDELKNSNPTNVLRLMNNNYTREKIANI